MPIRHLIKTEKVEFESALNKVLINSGNENDNKIVSKAILEQIFTGWPYLLRMKGVCYQIGSLLMDIGRNNQNKNERDGI